PELVVQMGQVLFDRGLADRQRGCDLPGRSGLGEDLAFDGRLEERHEHVALARREARDALGYLGDQNLAARLGPIDEARAAHPDLVARAHDPVAIDTLTVQEGAVP